MGMTTELNAKLDKLCTKRNKIYNKRSDLLVEMEYFNYKIENLKEVLSLYKSCKDKIKGENKKHVVDIYKFGIKLIEDAVNGKGRDSNSDGIVFIKNISNKVEKRFTDLVRDVLVHHFK